MLSLAPLSLAALPSLLNSAFRDWLSPASPDGDCPPPARAPLAFSEEFPVALLEEGGVASACCRSPTAGDARVPPPYDSLMMSPFWFRVWGLGFEGPEIHRATTQNPKGDNED